VRRGCFAWLKLCLACLLGMPGCFVQRSFPPKQAVIAAVEVEGLPASDVSSVLDGLATVASPRFLGIWDGVGFEYEVFDPELLKQDLLRIERYLLARGYFEARVTAARVIQLDAHRVRVELSVHTGGPVITNAISLDGLEQAPLGIAVDALGEIRLRSGKPFDEDVYENGKLEIVRVLNNQGYAFADVKGQVKVDIAAHRADVRYRVTLGQRAVFGPIRITGLKEIPERVVRDQVALHEGAPYSRAELEDARRALTALGVFADVKVKPDLEAAVNQSVPITITIEESQLRSVRIGVGALLDTLQAAAHVSVGWEDRNFLGGARHLALEGKPGLVFFPTRFGNLQAPNRELFKGQVNANFRQPSLFEGRTTGLLSGSFNLSPLLYAESEADSPLIGFAEVRASVGLERAFLSQRLRVTPTLNWERKVPVDYRYLSLGRKIDAAEELLEPLTVAYPELFASFDLRDNALAPRRGLYLTANLQWANQLIGSQVNDFRIRPEARFYLPISRSVVLAARFGVGLLLARNYALGDTSVPGAQDRRSLARDQQKLVFRGFFSGGANSNRGYPIGGVGPHGEVLFLTPNATFCQARQTEHQCHEPLGGVSLWEASLEVRFDLFGPVGGVWFADSSNVSDTTTLDFGAPHVSTGAGLRYATPLGALRLDVGFRLPYLQKLGEKSSDDAPTPNPAVPGIHLTLGEAF
jgi:outer membrane protein insertion porin family/translocation and assembly module TamA